MDLEHGNMCLNNSNNFPLQDYILLKVTFPPSHRNLHLEKITLATALGDRSNKYGSSVFNPGNAEYGRICMANSSLVLGDPRTNQNPAFLTLGILFYRWHNVLAERIQKKHPNWKDENIFQAARRLNIATLQVKPTFQCNEAGMKGS